MQFIRIAVFFIAFLPFSAKGQVAQDLAPVIISGKSMAELRRESGRIGFSPGLPVFPVPFPAVKPVEAGFFPDAALQALFSPAAEMPRIYSYDELGIFCKLEVQLERAAKLPVRIRLGDVPYVDYLEGKRERIE